MGNGTTVQAGKRATYPAYKPSGTPWLGDVPEHWEVRRLKYSADLINQKVDGAEADLPYMGLEHIESWTGKRLGQNGDASSDGQANLFRRGDVLFGKLRPYLAKAYAADSEGICTGELLVLRPKAVEQKFLLDYVLNPDFVTIVDSSTYGAKMPRANWDFIGNLPTLIPPLDEQKAIAAFLDRETARIDALIEKKQRQIELLQEKRSALISHAVTKGLDPNAPMKDSDIEWLGQIPKHWEIRRLKFLLDAMIDTEHKTVPFYEDGEYLVVRTSNVRNGTLVLDGAKYTDVDGYREWTRRGKPRAGDILFTREAPAGEACRVPSEYPCCIGQRMVLFRVRQDRLNDRFGVYSIYSGLASVFIRLLSQGSTVAHFNMRDIGSIPMLAPSVDEQIRIADWLDHQCERISTLVEAVESSIEKLKEHRTALISAAVTGKIDVRQRTD